MAPNDYNSHDKKVQQFLQYVKIQKNSLLKK